MHLQVFAVELGEHIEDAAVNLLEFVVVVRQQAIHFVYRELSINWGNYCDRTGYTIYYLDIRKISFLRLLFYCYLNVG